MGRPKKVDEEEVDALYDKFGEILSEGDEVLILGVWRGYIITIEMTLLNKEAGKEPVAVVEYNGKVGSFVTPEIQLVRYTK